MKTEIIRLDALLEAEQGFRRELNLDPSDTCTRLLLASCLFVQAVHAAGRDCLTAAGPEVDSNAPCEPGEPEAAISNSEAERLLKDCLRQTTVVMYLSRDEQERNEVELLQKLIGMAAANGAVDAPAEDARRCLLQMTRAIARSAGDLPRCKSKRRRIPITRAE